MRDDHLLLAGRLLSPPLLLSVRFSLTVFHLIPLPALEIVLSDGRHQGGPSSAPLQVLSYFLLGLFPQSVSPGERGETDLVYFLTNSLVHWLGDNFLSRRFWSLGQITQF